MLIYTWTLLLQLEQILTVYPQKLSFAVAGSSCSSRGRGKPRGRMLLLHTEGRTEAEPTLSELEIVRAIWDRLNQEAEDDTA